MKKGQIQAGELVMVVIIVVVLLVVGLVAYSYFQREGVQEQTREFESLEAVDLAKEAASLPVIACGFSDETVAECVDKYRLEAAADVIGNAEPDSDTYNYYRSKFRTATITVHQIYPTEEEWVLWNVTPGQPGGELPVRMPVYVYDPVSKENKFGYMKVVTYS